MAKQAAQIWKTSEKAPDPVLSNYVRINPAVPGVVQQGPDQWVLYRTPANLTDRISSVEVVCYGLADGPDVASTKPLRT